MLTVWGRATSSNVQKVMWTVAELDLPHERIDVGGPFGGLDTPAYRRLNPHGKIPAVETADGLVLWESNAIVRHLARNDPARRLWPAGGQAEADADMWAEWAQTTTVVAITALFLAVVRTAPKDRDEALIARHLATASEGLAAADAQLSRHPFLTGDRLTIADIVFGHSLYRWHEMEIARPALDNVSAYYARLCARAAYATHVMVDFSSLRVA